MCVSVHTYLYLCIHIYTYMYVHTCMCMYVYTDTNMCVHTHTFFIFFSIMVYYRILNRVPCAIQKDLVVYVFYI